MSKTPCPPNQISATDFTDVFGGSTPIQLSNYYGCDPEVPSSGQISYDDMRCIPENTLPILPPVSYEPFEAGACYPVTGDIITGPGNPGGRRCESVGWGYPGPYGGGGMGIALTHNFQSTVAQDLVNICGHVWTVGSLSGGNSQKPPKRTVTQNSVKMNFFYETRTRSDVNARTWYAVAGQLPYLDENGHLTTTGTDDWIYDMTRKQGREGTITTGPGSIATPEQRAVGTNRGLISLMNAVNIQSPHNTVGSIRTDYVTWTARKVNKGDEFYYPMKVEQAPSTKFNCNTYRFLSAGFINPYDGYQESIVGGNPYNYGQGYMAIKSMNSANFTRWNYSPIFGYAALEYGNKQSSAGNFVWYSMHDLPSGTIPTMMETVVKVLTT